MCTLGADDLVMGVAVCLHEGLLIYISSWIQPSFNWIKRLFNGRGRESLERSTNGKAWVCGITFVKKCIFLAVLAASITILTILNLKKLSIGNTPRKDQELLICWPLDCTTFSIDSRHLCNLLTEAHNTKCNFSWDLYVYTYVHTKGRENSSLSHAQLAVYK